MSKEKFVGVINKEVGKVCPNCRVEVRFDSCPECGFNIKLKNNGYIDVNHNYNK